VTMYQLLSQEHGSWSMDTGQLRKASEGNLSVELWVKNQVGWLYLQQHLDGHPVWELMESWRVAVTRDVQARLDRSVYEHSMEKVGANPQQTWMVGDNLYFDVGGAQKLGIWGIWVDWRRSGVSDDSMVKPDRIVHLISELIDST